jgi:hypothetical protein
MNIEFWWVSLLESCSVREDSRVKLDRWFSGRSWKKFAQDHVQWRTFALATLND